MNIQWYPGHMAKTRGLIQQNLKYIDLVVELLDARIPLSSRNPEIDKLTGQKHRLIVMNKSDLADNDITGEWIGWFNAQNMPAIQVDSVTGKGLNNVLIKSKQVLKSKIEQQRQKGLYNRPIKIMVVGIPNIGKSTFINKLSGRSVTKTGRKPGVTKDKQWISLKNGYELLDTPGILWPKFDDINVGMKLAYTGAIKDEIMDIEHLSCELLGFLKENYPQNIKSRYNIEDIYLPTNYELLNSIGRNRGYLISGGDVDTFRTATAILDDYRSSKLGKISLEKPNYKKA